MPSSPQLSGSSPNGGGSANRGGGGDIQMSPMSPVKGDDGADPQRLSGSAAAGGDDGLSSSGSSNGDGATLAVTSSVAGSTSATNGILGSLMDAIRTRQEPVLFLPALLIAITFLALGIAFTGHNVLLETQRSHRGEIAMHMTQFTLQTIEELQESVRFIIFRNASATTRELVSPLLATQRTTVDWLQLAQEQYMEYFEDDAVFGGAYNPFTKISFATLRSMQYRVLQRSVTVDQVLAFYQGVLNAAVNVTSHVLALQVEPYAGKLYSAARVAYAAARNGIDRAAMAAVEANGRVATVTQLQVAAASAWDTTTMQTEVLPLMATLLSTAGVDTSAAAAAVGSSATASVQALLASYSATGSLSVTASGPLNATTTPSLEAALKADLMSLSSSLDAVGASRATDSRSLKHAAIALGSAAVGLSLVILGAVVLRAVQAALQEAQEAQELTQLMALEASYRRMEAFIGSITTMNSAGIRTLEGKQVHSVERDVYTLEASTKQLFSFLHPCIAAFRSGVPLPMSAVAGAPATAPVVVGEDGVAVVVDPNATGVQGLSGNGETGQPGGASNGAAVAGLNGEGAGGIGGGAAGHHGANPLLLQELIPRRLMLQQVSLLFIDLEHWQTRVTSELAKVVPREFATFIQRITQIVETNQGVVHEFSASKLICAWNLDGTCHEMETCSSAALVALHKSLAVEYPHLRFAVLTGECSVGVTGTESLKTMTVIGPILPLGEIFLRLNRIHGTAACVCDTTFAKLDGQMFRTRPMEVVGVHAASKRTVAFELQLGSTPADKDGRGASWNEAFDEYKSGNFERAKYLLRRWQQNFGETRSLHRLVSLLSENPPRTCTLKQNDDGLLEDELL